MSINEKVKEALKRTLSIIMEKEEIALAATQELKISDMVVGGKVEIVNPDGTLSPAPDGEYTQNEDVLVVKDGMIESINGDKGEAMPVEEMADTPVEDAPVANDMQVQLDELKATTESLKASIEEIKTMLGDKTAEQKMSAINEDLTSKIDELNATIKTILVTPAEFSKTNTSIRVKDDKEAKMNDMLKVFASRKK